MRLMIVGAGSGQLRAIRKARSMGIETVVSDRNPLAPGMKTADFAVPADTFDPDATEEAARKYKVDGIATLGTDQPVLTVTMTADRIGLPHSLSVRQALEATNKRYMKPMMERSGVPHNPYRLLGPGSDRQAGERSRYGSGSNYPEVPLLKKKLRGLKPPFVLKPVDSQGQRGVLYAETMDEVLLHLPETLSYSREGYALVEEYYPGEEITFSGWVRDGLVYPLTITDRRTINSFPHIGICFAHTYPSRHFLKYGDEILDIAERIAGEMGLRSGPVYFQMLIGSEGIRVNEIACRIGGAYEDELIPLLTGVDMDVLLFSEALGVLPGSTHPDPTENTSAFSPGASDVSFAFASPDLDSFSYPAREYAAVLLHFTEPMRVGAIGKKEELLGIPGVESTGYLLTFGRRIDPMRNSTGRAGYTIIRGSSPEKVNASIREVYRRFRVLDTEGNNRILDFTSESLLE